jgi:LysM repeat protein
MRKTVSVLVTALALLASGCGVSETDHNVVVSERDALREQLAKIQKENEALKENAQELERENKGLVQRLEKAKAEAVPEPPPPAKQAAKREKVETRGKFYEVKKGDNLWEISRQTNVPVKRLQELNGLKGTKLQIGQKLLLSK